MGLAKTTSCIKAAVPSRVLAYQTASSCQTLHPCAVCASGSELGESPDTENVSTATRVGRIDRVRGTRMGPKWGLMGEKCVLRRPLVPRHSWRCIRRPQTLVQKGPEGVACP